MTFRIVATPTPVSAEAIFCHAPDGLSIAEALTGKTEPVKQPLLVEVDGLRVPQERLHLVKPKPGTTVTVKRALHGSDGGGKNILSAVLSLAVIAASFIFAPYLAPVLVGIGFGAGTAAALAPALIGTVGLLAVSALVPPAAGLKQNSGQGNEASKASPNYSISGARNALQPWGVVPVVLGRHRMVPPLAAQPYTELRGGKQYFRMAVVWGYGRLNVSNIKIGDTPLNDYDEVDQDTVDGSSLVALSKFPGVVDQQNLSVVMRDGVTNTRRTAVETDEISVDFTFPEGLFEIDEKKGKLNKREVRYKVRHRNIAGGGTVTVEDKTIDRKRTEAFQVGNAWGVSRGQYDVEVERETNDHDDDENIHDDIVWTALRSIKHKDPINFPKPLAKTALVIRASEQLNGPIDDLNAIVESYALDWTGSNWVYRVTRNPASLYRLVLQHPGNAKAVSDDELWLDELAHWHEFCAANGYTFNQIIDFETTVGETLQRIAAAGRASPQLRDGKWTVVIDEPKTAIAGHITPHNARDFRGEKIFTEMPHAFRCRFVNEQNDYYRQDERIVYAPGYDASNAALFESLDFPGVTNPDHVYKLARYHLAVALLRPERYSFTCGIEHVIFTRGDRLKLLYDVPAFGLASGRVKAVEGDAGNPEQLARVTLDNACPMAADRNYAIRFRLGHGTSVYANVLTEAGEQTVLDIVDEIELAGGPAKGDLFQFGEAGKESVDVLVVGIQPNDDLTALVTCVDYAPDVFNAHSGTIPAFNSQITLPPNVARNPLAPTIRNIQSDTAVAARANDGSLLERVVITCDPPSDFQPAEVILEGQARLVGSDDWEEPYSQGRPDSVTIGGMAGGDLVDLRVRRVTSVASRYPGRTSPWTVLPNYQVIGKTDLPPDVIDLKMEGTRAVWRLPVVPLDLAGFELRISRGTNVGWEQAVPVQTHLIAATEFDLSWLKGGVFTIHVKAVDDGERYSQNAAAMVIDLGDAVLGNVFQTLPYHSVGFALGNNSLDQLSGEVTNGSLIGGELQSAVTIGFWDSNQAAAFWKPDSELFWQDAALEMTYAAHFVSELGHVGVELSLEHVIQASRFDIDYRTDGDGLAFTGNDDELVFTSNDEAILIDETAWRPWPGKLTVRGRERFNFRLVTAAGIVQGVISEFTVKLDVPDIGEKFDDLEIPSDGLRLPLTRNYDAIKTVIGTVVDDAGGGHVVKTFDKNPALGPLVKVMDASGNPVAGKADIDITGYKIGTA